MREALQDQFEAIIENTPNVAIQGYDAQGRVTFWNRASTQLYGFEGRDALGKTLGQLIFSPQEEEEFQRMIALILASGRPAPIREWPIIAASGERRYILSSLFPIRFGEQTRVICMDVDITERKRAEESVRLNEERSRQMAVRLQSLINELDHRVKNNLASLEALVGLYERASGDVQAFAQAIRGKLRAMSSAHELTTAASGGPVALNDLVRRIAQQFEFPDRRRPIAIQGPAVQIPPRQVGPLVMIIHELMTNAFRHGAYRGPGGSASIQWHIAEGEAGRVLALEWAEQSEMPIAQPSQFGVGLRLIEGFARHELGGEARFTFQPNGFHCRLHGVLDRSEDPPAMPAGSPGPG